MVYHSRGSDEFSTVTTENWQLLQNAPAKGEIEESMGCSVSATELTGLRGTLDNESITVYVPKNQWKRIDEGKHGILKDFALPERRSDVHKGMREAFTSRVSSYSDAEVARQSYGTGSRPLEIQRRTAYEETKRYRTKSERRRNQETKTPPAPSFSRENRRKRGTVPRMEAVNGKIQHRESPEKDSSIWPHRSRIKIRTKNVPSKETYRDEGMYKTIKQGERAVDKRRNTNPDKEEKTSKIPTRTLQRVLTHRPAASKIKRQAFRVPPP
jgi:hypothetical protein